MSYPKHNFQTGHVFTAAEANQMDEGIHNNDARLSALEASMADAQDDLEDLQEANADTRLEQLEQDVSDLQAAVGGHAATLGSYGTRLTGAENRVAGILASIENGSVFEGLGLTVENGMLMVRVDDGTGSEE